MRKSNNTPYIVGGVLLVAAIVLFIMKPSIKLGYKNYKKEPFQTIADVKLARAKAGAEMFANKNKEGFASTRVGKKSEGFQDTTVLNTSNILAANPLPMNTAAPNVVTLANNAAMPSMQSMPSIQTMPSMPTVTMNALSNAMMPNKPASVTVGTPSLQKFTNMNDMQGNQYRKGAKEGFTSGNYSETAGGAKDSYEPIGAFDNVALSTGNNVSSWRYTAPDEALLGAPFEVGQDNLFMFKNNQCKPECCGSSLSCSGGCVCTTPDQRQYIASRGGNRTRPQDD